jgi:hypothetical protein
MDVKGLSNIHILEKSGDRRFYIVLNGSATDYYHFVVSVCIHYRQNTHTMAAKIAETGLEAPQIPSISCTLITHDSEITYYEFPRYS